jgi:hypothetical protein
MELVVRLFVLVGLGIQAVVHLRLAPNYQLASPDGIGGGNLFRIESVSAILAGLYLLLRGSRPAYVLAAAVALGGFAAVVLYRYVDVGSFGPIPAMYEPIWFFEKNISAIAEATAGSFALVGSALAVRVPRHPRRRHVSA